MPTLEISKQAYHEIRDRLLCSNFAFQIKHDDMGEKLDMRGLNLQASQGFDNQEVKKLKEENRSLACKLAIANRRLEIVGECIDLIQETINEARKVMK